MKDDGPADRPGIPQVGDVAPDFKLLNASREIWHLDERVGQQPTILILYRGHWCPFCVRQLADFRDHLDAISAADFAVAGISTDALRRTALLQAEMFIPFDLLSDLDRSMLEEWDLLNTKKHGGIPVPAVFAIGSGREVLARSVGTMMHQIHPLEFLKTVKSETRRPGRRRLLLPRIFEFLKVSRVISRAGEEG